jgi:hypothetical protein
MRYLITAFGILISIGGLRDASATAAKKFSEYKFSFCEVCNSIDSNAGPCLAWQKEPVSYKGMKIFSDKIYLYILNDKDNVVFTSYPDNPKMRCDIDEGNGHAFSCRAVDRSSSPDINYSSENRTEMLFSRKTFFMTSELKMTLSNSKTNRSFTARRCFVK